MFLLGQSPPSPPSVLPAKAPPVEEQPPMAAPPTPMPKWSPRLKRWTSFARATGEHIHRWGYPKGYAGEDPLV